MKPLYTYNFCAQRCFLCSLSLPQSEQFKTFAHWLPCFVHIHILNTNSVLCSFLFRADLTSISFVVFYYCLLPTFPFVFDRKHVWSCVTFVLDRIRTVRTMYTNCFGCSFDCSFETLTSFFPTARSILGRIRMGVSMNECGWIKPWYHPRLTISKKGLLTRVPMSNGGRVRHFCPNKTI